MKLYHKYLLYQSKWLEPYINLGINLMSWITYLASLLYILAVVYEHGFTLSPQELAHVQALKTAVWIIFLLDLTLQLMLERSRSRHAFNTFSWILTVLTYFTLVPVIFHRPEVSGAIQQFYDIVVHPTYRFVLLLVLSLLNLSNGVARLMGRRTNPSLILAVSFLMLAIIGTGLLMLPRCTFGGISWVDAMFVSTSAVCVTGLSPVDVAQTFTPEGQIIILILLQVGGLGVMTFTSFFALFFMGNTSIYNQLVVRDMVSSNSLGSLLSTMLYILGFTLAIEGVGMLAIWTDIHGTLDMTFSEELWFSVFHAVSAFCNAGFSTMPDGMSNATLMSGSHLPLYLYISLLVLMGGIGFPILVNFKDIFLYQLRRLWRLARTGQWDGRRYRHLYNLNTRIVLLMTLVLTLGGTFLIALFEWHGFLDGLPVAGKLTHAFFNAVNPRTAGFSSLPLQGMGVQSLLVYMLLMWIGGAAQSTAGGVKVNAFAVTVLNLVAVVRGTDRVEAFGREISPDSIRRSNATVVMSLAALFLGVCVISWLEPQARLLEVAFECVSALSTVGTSMGLTPELHSGAKMVLVLMMFVGRVGLITLMLGIVRQKKHTKYRYPSGQIIIN